MKRIGIITTTENPQLERKFAEAALANGIEIVFARCREDITVPCDIIHTGFLTSGGTTNSLIYCDTPKVSEVFVEKKRTGWKHPYKYHK